jgi:hypothetical protein
VAVGVTGSIGRSAVCGLGLRSACGMQLSKRPVGVFTSCSGAVSAVRWPRRWERIFALGSFLDWVALPQHQLPQHGTRMGKGVLHCTALRCAARKIREIHAPLLLDVGCWLLDIGCCNLDHRSKFMLTRLLLCDDATCNPLARFLLSRPSRPNEIGSIGCLLPPECLNIMSSVVCFLFLLCSPPDALRHANFAIQSTFTLSYQPGPPLLVKISTSDILDSLIPPLH